MTRNHLLLIAAIFALFLNGCATPPPDNFNIAPTYVLAPVVADTPVPATEDTPVSPTADTSWPTVPPSTAKFDYYVLALSWAPDYCSANPGDSQECSLGRKYAFVLHGLWPQYNKGYPSNCGSESLPASVKAKFPHLYPSDKLFDHEWSKHGACSGLSPTDYLTLAGQLKAQLQVPATYRAPDAPFHTTADDLKQAFLQANPALIDASLAVNCSGSGRVFQKTANRPPAAQMCANPRSRVVRTRISSCAVCGKGCPNRSTTVQCGGAYSFHPLCPFALFTTFQVEYEAPHKR
jgi:ribonuclease T2